MPMQCSSCQTPFDGKFCPACGTPAQAATPAAAPEAPAPNPLLGQMLGGKYKVLKVLGEGGMGCVYKGEQLLGTKTRAVAIKTLHPHLSNDAKILARFEREVGTVAELEHPNTIQVHDYGKTDAGVLYIVMEFIQGQNLADTLEKGGAMEPARVAKIMEQVCGSLEEAHQHGIVHRDLKPDNVVLTERAGSKDFVKVLDFGIAKRSNEEDKNEQKLTQQGMVLGTPPYMSPEQFTGKPIDARSDIYSLGIMAYEMLTGNLPFEADTAWEWATKHMTAPPRDIDTMPFHERIPPRMKDALRRALQKEPQDRFANVREFLEAFVATGPGAATGAVTAQLAAGKGRTEIATPLGYGGPPGGAPPNMGAPGPQAAGYGPPAQAGTPALGNVAFPTPGAMPQTPHGPPSDAPSGGGSRSMLLGIAGVVAVLSVGAIGFALKGHAPAKDEPFPMPSAAPADSVDDLVGLDAGAPPVIEPAPSGSAFGPLHPPGAGAHAVHPGKEPPSKEPPGREHDGGKEPPGKEPSPSPKGSASGKASAPPPSPSAGPAKH
jgi:serine/threonine-protein kinase